MKTMRVLWAIAWRNLWRNSRRTLLTTGTIAGGIGLLLVFFGLSDGAHGLLLQNAVRLGGAHVAVQAEGYQAKKAIEMTLPAGLVPDLTSALVASGFDGATVVPRIFASGLASSPDGSSSVSIVGLDPAAEATASWLDERLESGSFLVEGQANAAVVGQGVARKLKLAPGNKFVLMSQGPDSPEIQSVLTRVAGVIGTGIGDIDQFGVYIPLAAAQTLLGLQGRIHQVALILDSPGRVGRAARALHEASGEGTEVLGWQELMPSIRDLIQVDIAGMFIFEGIFFLIVAFLVGNTLLMSVLERRREFALLDAVGLTPFQRFLLIMLEASWIDALSAASGAGLGYLGHLYFHHKGLDLSFLYDRGFRVAGAAIDPIIYSALSVRRGAVGVGLIFGLTLFLALWPARRAAAEVDSHLLGQT